MSVTEAAAPSKARSFFRVWFPLVVFVLAAVIVTVLWSIPSKDWARERRVTYTWITALATLLALTVWWLFLSGLRWVVTASTLLAILVAVLASVREVKFTSDMEPVFRFHWDASPNDTLEEHRRKQAKTGAVPAVVVAEVKSTDFPEYRGRQRDGVVSGPALARNWETHPPRELWRQPAGAGYAGFTVVGNLLVTLEQRRDEEVVVGYDTASGRELWTHAWPAHFKETLGGPGPRATPTIAGSDVYALGATGVLVCLNAADGKPKWKANILESNDNIQWAMSGSPLVYDNLVVVNPGKQTDAAAGKAVVAYDRATGKPVWSAGNTPAGYSSPMLATLAGRRQVVLLDGESLAGYDAADGKELWRFPWEVYQGINVAQPVLLDGDRIFISSGYNKGCAMLQVSAAGVKELWSNREMRCKFTSPVLHEGYLYGMDEGILVCLDPKDGKRKWKDGRYGNGQVLVTGDLLVIWAETGKLALVEATPEEHRELASLTVFKERKNWNPHALADGKVYVRNHEDMACFDLTGAGR